MNVFRIFVSLQVLGRYGFAMPSGRQQIEVFFSTSVF